MSRTGFAGVGGGGIRVRIESVGSSAFGGRHGTGATGKGRVDLERLAPQMAAVIENTAPEINRFTSIGIGVTGLPGLVKDPDTLWHVRRSASQS